MRRIDARLIIGLLLIAGGVVYLLQNLGFITWGSAVWAAAFLIGAVAFLVMFVRDRAAWWAIIPGLTLLGLGGNMALELVNPAAEETWGGSLFLGSLGLAFLIIYLRDRGQWWAIIPGGVLVSLAVVSGLDNLNLPIETGGIFFLGLGQTFLLVALLPTSGASMRWAFFPAAALLAMGILIAVGFERAINYLWPLALILGGLFLLVRAARRPA
jgi:hypothetical protein